MRYSNILNILTVKMDEKVVSLHPYYKVNKENLLAFKSLANDLIETTRGEMGCLYYEFTFAEDEVHCREAYKNAEMLLAHLDNIEDLNHRLSEIATITRLEIHGPSQELAKLKEFDPMKKLNPKYFVLEKGFRN